MLRCSFLLSFMCFMLFSPLAFASADLFEAVKSANIEAVNAALVNADIEAINAADDDATPLISASKTNSTEIMSLLISKGADIEATDGRGRTALIWASMNNNLEAIQLLIDNGVDINYETKNFATALNVAQAFKKPEAVELLLANGAIEKERRRKR